jgi:hypothetical protein
MNELFEYVAGMVGTDSLEYVMVKKYIQNEEDVRNFDKISLHLQDEPIINQIIFYVEWKLLMDKWSENWLEMYQEAFKSKEGLIDLIKLNAVENPDILVYLDFVDEYFTDEMTQDFLKNHFSGDFDRIEQELLDYYHEGYSVAC